MKHSATLGHDIHIPPIRRGETVSVPVMLPDGQTTTLHISVFPRDKVDVRLAVFPEAERLQDWCGRTGIKDAIVGGFFWRVDAAPLGELWLNGQKVTSKPFDKPWHHHRSCLHSVEGRLQIAPRYELPDTPDGDLLQAGPMLVNGGVAVVSAEEDPEGFSAGAHQFDSDITEGRHPRAAVGYDQDTVWAVVSDGRSKDEAGLTLEEFSIILEALGVQTALNLDGGGSTTLVSDGKMINVPREAEGDVIAGGRPIHTAITFLKR